MALPDRSLFSLRVFVIICLLGVLGWYALNTVLLHEVVQRKNQVELPFPIGRLLFIAVPILATIWFTGSGKRVGFWIYAVFALMFAGFILAGLDAASVADMRSELIFQFVLLMLPLPLLHFALPLKRDEPS